MKITSIMCIVLIILATISTLISFITGKTIELGLGGNIITFALGYIFGKNDKK